MATKDSGSDTAVSTTAVLDTGSKTTGGATPSTTGDTAPAILVRGRDGRGTEINLADVPAGKWTRVRLTVAANEIIVWHGDKEVRRVPVSTGARGAFGLRDTGAVMEFGNLHVRTL